MTLSAALIPVIAIVVIAASVTPQSSSANSPWTRSPAASEPQQQDKAVDPTPPQSPSTAAQPDVDVRSNWPPADWDEDAFDKGLLYYEDGSVLYRYLDVRDITCPADAEYAWCWTLEVISKVDCPGGIQLQGDIYDIYERNVGLIEILTPPAIAGEIVVVPIGSGVEDAKDAYVTSAQCR